MEVPMGPLLHITEYQGGRRQGEMRHLLVGADRDAEFMEWNAMLQATTQYFQWGLTEELILSGEDGKLAATLENEWMQEDRKAKPRRFELAWDEKAGSFDGAPLLDALTIPNGYSLEAK